MRLGTSAASTNTKSMYMARRSTTHPQPSSLPTTPNQSIVSNMRALSLLCLASLALAASISRRDATQVNDDITGISNAVLELTATLNAYTGGIQEASPVFNATLAVHAINRKAYNDVNASPGPFTSADSAAIVQNVQDSVGVTIPASVTVLESKKPLFDAANLTSLIEATVLLLKYDHESFSLATGAKLSADEVAAGALAAGKIDASLTGAALYYAL